MGNIRVVLADDNLLIRQGVASLIEAIADVELVESCETVDQLIAAVESHQPDAVITDIRMPPTNTDEGIKAAQSIRASHGEIGVVVLSQFSDPAFVLELFATGSEGLAYLLKDRVSPGDLERALKEVTSGGSVVDPKIVEVLVQSRSDSPISMLTPRERDVVELIAQGLNNTTIAETLVLSPRAVGKHINSIFSKLGLSEEDTVDRRVKAVLMWLSDS